MEIDDWERRVAQVLREEATSVQPSAALHAGLLRIARRHRRRRLAWLGMGAAVIVGAAGSAVTLDHQPSPGTFGDMFGRPANATASRGCVDRYETHADGSRLAPSATPHGTALEAATTEADLFLAAGALNPAEWHVAPGGTLANGPVTVQVRQLGDGTWVAASIRICT